MLSILFYWFIILLFTLGIGQKISRFIGIKANEPIFDFLNGLYYYLMISWIASYFTGVYSSILLILIILSGIFSVVNILSTPVNPSLKLFIDKKILLFFVTLVLIVAFNSSLVPFLPDNESYYVQTIKWAGQYGLVPGLINLHPFLGQFSGWHILQAAMFGYENRFFNDLNGLLFILFVFFVLKKLLSFLNRTENKTDALIGLQIIIIPFLFLFVNSPSPDLPVFIIAQLIFYLFVKNYNRISDASVKQMILLFFFALMIKLTALPLVVFPLLLIIKKASKSLSIFFAIFLFFTLILCISKNLIISGYLFYPFSCCSGIIHFLWKYPPELMEFMNNLGRNESQTLQFNRLVLSDFLSWLLKDKIHTVLHIFWVFLLFVFPWASSKFKINKSLIIIYITALFYFLTLLFIQPNFRFFFYFIPFLFIGVSYSLFSKFRFQYLLFFSLLLIIPLNVYMIKTGNQIDWDTIFIRNRVSGYDKNFKQGKIENLLYYYPENKALFWETGNAPLPAVNKNQLEYFMKYKNYYPQKIKKDLKSGFYSKKIE